MSEKKVIENIEPDPSEALRISVTQIVGNVVYVDIRIRGSKDWIYLDGIDIPKGGEVIIVDGQPKASEYVSHQIKRQQPTEWEKRMKLNE